MVAFWRCNKVGASTARMGLASKQQLLAAMIWSSGARPVAGALPGPTAMLPVIASDHSPSDASRWPAVGSIPLTFTTDAGGNCAPFQTAHPCSRGELPTADVPEDRLFPGPGRRIHG